MACGEMCGLEAEVSRPNKSRSVASSPGAYGSQKPEALCSRTHESAPERPHPWGPMEEVDGIFFSRRAGQADWLGLIPMSIAEVGTNSILS